MFPTPIEILDFLHSLEMRIYSIRLEKVTFTKSRLLLFQSSVLGALHSLADAPMDVVLLENVGNLVCPAEFDTGANVNIVVLSVTEGEDKPLKYPLMFRNSHVGIINKVDLAEAVEANVPLIKEHMLQVNPHLELFETSAKAGDGVGRLAEWIGGGGR